MTKQPSIDTAMSTYNAIVKYIDENGLSPTLRDITAITGKSPSNVLYHVQKLQAEGFITYVPSKARTIQLAKKVENET